MAGAGTAGSGEDGRHGQLPDAEDRSAGALNLRRSTLEEGEHDDGAKEHVQSLVETYWRGYFLDQVESMSNPGAFFCRQSEALSDRVAELEQTLVQADPVPEGEGYLARLGRLTNARVRAEEMAIAELLPTPDNDEELAGSSEARRKSLGEDESRPNP